MHLRRAIVLGLLASCAAAAGLLACSGGDDPQPGNGAGGDTDAAGSSTGSGNGGSTSGGDDASGATATGSGAGMDAGAKLDGANASDAKLDGGAFGEKCTTIGSPGDCQPGLECFNFGAKGKRCTMPCDAGVACPLGCTTNMGVCKVQ